MITMVKQQLSKTFYLILDWLVDFGEELFCVKLRSENVNLGPRNTFSLGSQPVLNKPQPKRSVSVRMSVMKLLHSLVLIERQEIILIM